MAEDQRIFKSKVSDWIAKYGAGTTDQEKNAMEYIAAKIFDHYLLKCGHENMSGNYCMDCGWDKTGNYH